MQLQRKAPVPFELVAVNLEQKQPGVPAQVLPDYLRTLGVTWHVIEQDSYSVVSRLVPGCRAHQRLAARRRRVRPPPALRARR